MSRTKDRTYMRNRAKCKAEQDTCWRCGQWIDPELVWPHPMSWTADHVQAIKHGGRNDGELRACHSRCNIQAGNRKHKNQTARHARSW